MKHSTVTIVEVMLILLTVLVNGSLQLYGLLQLNKSTVDIADVQYARTLLMAGVIVQMVAAVVLILALMVMYHFGVAGKYSTVLLVICGMLLLTGGSLGAAAAVRLQCYKTTPGVSEAHQMSTITAVLGVLGTMIVLMVQVFLNRGRLAGAARQQLITKRISIPTHAPIKDPIQSFSRSQAPKGFKPSHNPPPYKRSAEEYKFA